MSSSPTRAQPFPRSQSTSDSGDGNAGDDDDRAHANDDQQTQTQLEQALKRTVTLVIWYKSNCDPVRLAHQVPTFPLFALSRFPSLVSDLALTPTSYLDTYNVSTGYWEQHTLTTVRTVECDQRLLYKLRRGLLTGLADNECVGLADELALLLSRRTQAQAQPPLVSAPPLKRPVSVSAEVSSPKRLFPADPYPVYIPPPGYVLPPHAMTLSYASPLSSVNPPQLSSEPGSSSFHPGATVAVPHTSMYNPGPSTPSMAISPVGRSPFAHSPSTPFTPHPPAAAHGPPQSRSPLSLKRWPNDYTVSELAAGFREMDMLASQTPGMTQRAAFEHVFGVRYVKSTVCRHRAVYRKADPAVRAAFEDMRECDKAVWGEFVRKVEGRSVSGKVVVVPSDVIAGNRQGEGDVPREEEGGRVVDRQDPRAHAGDDDHADPTLHQEGSDVGESTQAAS